VALNKLILIETEIVSMRKLMTLGAAGVLAVSTILAIPSVAQATPVKYANCAALNKKYAYGVAAKDAKDKVTSNYNKVTKFTVNTAVYNANKHLDPDKDKISCELLYYKNCALLNAKYPHGVGKPGAVDKTTGLKVINFTKHTALYTVNAPARDSDKDGIACEKR
jgi:hypothetical protein